MSNKVEIAFDCLPLRSIERMDVPLDASPAFEAFCHRVKQAADHHGLHNTYYLHHARCCFQLTNDEAIGLLQFSFEGTALTDPEDQKTLSVDLQVELEEETCDWITRPVVDWFRETVSQAVRVEFDRYIAAGDLGRTMKRMEEIQAESDAHLGFLGFGL